MSSENLSISEDEQTRPQMRGSSLASKDNIVSPSSRRSERALRDISNSVVAAPKSNTKRQRSNPTKEGDDAANNALVQIFEDSTTTNNESHTTNVVTDTVIVVIDKETEENNENDDDDIDLGLSFDEEESEAKSHDNIVQLTEAIATRADSSTSNSSAGDKIVFAEQHQSEVVSVETVETLSLPAVSALSLPTHISTAVNALQTSIASSSQALSASIEALLQLTVSSVNKDLSATDLSAWESYSAALAHAQRALSIIANAAEQPQSQFKGIVTIPSVEEVVVPVSAVTVVPAPSTTIETEENILQVFLKKDEELCVSDYMVQQPQVTVHMRAVLLDWLRDVVIEQRLHEETYFVAIRLLDRVLSVVNVPRKEVQLLGAACLLVAAKVEEHHAPPIRQFENLCERLYTHQQFVLMQGVLLKKLHYRVHSPHLLDFIYEAINIHGNVSADVKATCKYMAFYATMDYRLSVMKQCIVGCAILLYVSDRVGLNPAPFLCLIKNKEDITSIATVVSILHDLWKRYHISLQGTVDSSENSHDQFGGANPSSTNGVITLCKSVHDKLITANPNINSILARSSRTLSSEMLEQLNAHFDCC